MYVIDSVSFSLLNHRDQMKRGLPIIVSTKTASWISWASHFDFIIQLSIFMEENYIIIEGKHIFNNTIYNC